MDEDGNYHHEAESEESDNNIMPIHHDMLREDAKIYIGADCISNFVDDILEMKDKVKVLAWNGAKFDHIFVMKELARRGYTTQTFIGGGFNNLKYV